MTTDGAATSPASAGSLPRLVLAAALVAGVSYVASWGMDLPQPAAIAWKGAGVALLAVYAATLARSLDGWLIAGVMAFGALGDVLLETSGLAVGGAAFLAGHLLAIWLYLRNRRPRLSAADRALVLTLAPLAIAAAWLLPSDRGMAEAAALYSAGLVLMAAAAWASRFPRAWTGLGALMFVASDLLIFARAGPLEGQAWANLAVWGLYFGGQTLVCLGVTRTLGDRAPA